ncbi:hypothetical protein [uncultured Gammaproteobacteria bacterium]|uniref:hypothetical protein n=1 Tax=Bathymodiolus heckerae thiotrophic gill symbiont TaxID=1052212 RepID=UPI0010BA6AA6|nr:hypothetical protein [Bathymodiolus heckerae thiotrophic gill symbiont]CAC9440756.1 hypothetical protein [uncultured Gammaproteobacteria bacterium]SMN12742.1 hypothetical protein BHECKSOX2_896 [Bathymodiolus heckerae thiotrophic gill symbiont]SMN14489.1 hypothetical protein CRYPD_1292 [uncultured Candidatus Thioglobus sp.]
MSFNKNRAKIIYAVIFVSLFQLLSSTVFALTLGSEQGGKYLTVCTMQGYKQIWVNADNEQHDTNSADLSCPYCLLNMGALDVINTNVEHYFNFSNEYTNSFTTVQNTLQSEVLLKFLAIRAPPILS